MIVETRYSESLQAKIGAFLIPHYFFSFLKFLLFEVFLFSIVFVRISFDAQISQAFCALVIPV